MLDLHSRAGDIIYTDEDTTKRHIKPYEHYIKPSERFLRAYKDKTTNEQFYMIKIDPVVLGANQASSDMVRTRPHGIYFLG